MMKNLNRNLLIEVLRENFILKNLFSIINKPANELSPENPLAANCVKALIALGGNCESACKAVRSL